MDVKDADLRSSRASRRQLVLSFRAPLWVTADRCVCQDSVTVQQTSLRIFCRYAMQHLDAVPCVESPSFFWVKDGLVAFNLQIDDMLKSMWSI